MQRKFTRDIGSLEDIFEFAELFLAKKDVAEAVRQPVHMAMEELFTNMVKYNPENSEDILVSISEACGVVTVSLTDYDVEPFDVTDDRHVDTEASLEERTVGGLGLHLIHKMVDTLEYDYTDRQSTIIFSKGPEKADV